MKQDLMHKTRAVIFSCKTPAQLRTAARYAYLALGNMHMRSDQFDSVHLSIQRLLTVKAQTMRGRVKKWKF